VKPYEGEKETAIEAIPVEKAPRRVKPLPDYVLRPGRSIPGEVSRAH
jgi:hypothetical protein